jgi:hypothetical protein
MSSERLEVTAYKHSATLQHRTSRCEELLSLYADSVPVLVIPGSGLEGIATFKFIMPKTALGSTLIYNIRQKLYLNQTQGIFVYLADGTLMQRDMVLGSLYADKKDADNYLYLIAVTQEKLG